MKTNAFSVIQHQHVRLELIIITENYRIYVKEIVPYRQSESCEDIYRYGYPTKTYKGCQMKLLFLSIGVVQSSSHQFHKTVYTEIQEKVGNGA